MVNKIIIKASGYGIQNPYNMIELSLDGNRILGRPFEFDSDIVNHKTMCNAFGNLVKPTKVSTVCPQCGQGLIIDLNLGDPPYGVIKCTCKYCHPKLPPIVDPFMNPLEFGRVSHLDLDNTIHDVSKPLDLDTIDLKSFDIETSADADITSKKQAVTPKLKQTIETGKSAKKTSQPKKANQQPKNQQATNQEATAKPRLELNTEMGEEQDI